MTIKQLGLTVRQQRFIASEIKAGRYRSENDVLQAGLELLEKQNRAASQKEALIKELQVGIDELDAGHGVRLTNDAEISSFVKSAGKEARKFLKNTRKKVKS